MTAMRLPSVAISSSQRAVWTTSPVERVEPGNVRRERVMQHARRGDHEVRFKLAAVRGLDPPPGPGELGRDDRGVQPEMVAETELVDDIAQITLDLLAGREHADQSGFGANEN